MTATQLPPSVAAGVARVTNPRPPHEVQPRSTDVEHRLARCVELLAHCPPECRPHVAARLDALETLLTQVATPAEETPQ